MLAASYAFGIARNHAFVDGNKRTALVVSEAFLRLNGFRVAAAPEDKYLTFLHLAEGSLSEPDLAAWFTRHAVPFESTQ
jgi:death-on-curing protein